MLDDGSPGIDVLLFAAAAAVVWAAGTRLTRMADRLAELTGIGRGLVGLLLLGGITSLPEAGVGITATLSGAPLLSVNDVLGSASVNVVLLAVADAVYGRRALTSTPATPEVLLQGALSVLVLALAVAAPLAGDTLVGGMGVWSWALLAAYAGAVWIISRSQDLRSWSPQGPRPPPQADAGAGAGVNDAASPAGLVWRIALAGLAILVAGYVLARTGESLARQSGLGTSFFGAVLLALATSLPEVSTVLAAVRLGRHEMAMAGIFGTNLFNVNILVLVDALHDGPPVLGLAGPFAAFGALLALFLTVIYLVGLIERRDRTVLRMGIDSLAALACYAAGLFVLFGLRG